MKPPLSIKHLSLISPLSNKPPSLGPEIKLATPPPPMGRALIELLRYGKYLDRPSTLC